MMKTLMYTYIHQKPSVEAKWLSSSSTELGAAVQGGVTSMVDMMEAPPLPGSNVADAERRRFVSLRPRP